MKRHAIEGFEGEDLEEVVPIPRIYGGECDAPIVVGSQESKENTSGIYWGWFKGKLGVDMFSFSINTSAKEAEMVVQRMEEEKEMKQADHDAFVEICYFWFVWMGNKGQSDGERG